ncbi:hypothetical protein Mapa_012320 [Marchantia paleacea]|nr:hypothetical protein Mapa_012320 [Marchantia paleacea]
MQTHDLLHECRQVFTSGNVRLGDQVAAAEHGVELCPNSLQHVRVVAQLRDSPLDGPQGGLDGGDVDVLHDVQHVVEVDLPFLLRLEDEIDSHLLASLPPGLPGREHLLALVDEVLLEDGQSLILERLAASEVLLQKRPQDGDEITVIVIETLRELTPLAIHSRQPDKQLVLHGFEPPVEHHSVHDVVHHELQPAANDTARGGRLRVRLQILYHMVDLILPGETRLLNDFASEEGRGHDPTHPSPVIAVHGEHHVLSVPCEDVEHHIPRPGPKLHSLRVQNLLRQLWARDPYVVLDTHFQQEYVPVLFRHLGQISVVQIIPDLKPVPKYGHGARSRRKLQPLFSQFQDQNHQQRCRQKSIQNVLHRQGRRGTWQQPF